MFWKISILLLLSFFSAKVNAQPQSDSSYTEEQVYFSNANTILSASLILPKTHTKSPVIIFIHGDGPTNRDFYGYYRALWKRFTARGFACFAWDKPGVGKSTSPYGKYDRNYPISFYQRAAELRQAIQYLKSRAAIDSNQIGTWAISQGGWISTMVAANSKDIAFMIEVSCAGQTAVLQSEYQIALKMQDEGKSQNQIKDEILRFRHENDSLPKPKMSSDFFKYLGGKLLNWKKSFARSADYDGSFFIDPQPFLKKINCPILVIFGDKDRNVNFNLSAQVYQSALKGRNNLTVKIFKNADHILFNSLTGKDSEWREKLVNQRNYDYVSGYLELMVNWLSKLKHS